ncbi:hypothetical protein OV079_46160 [Nannocystis pusilla]|uniref:Uncharacterized protein n=1 Tax=Nannocystis pusilla TaxID=889268 RepID=A0A9X3F790_9BACT|nr:hypothetical protein [Nannocystis pusilla]MCY1012801.1 hypothetical protein [Nannocystis pusilla]
MRAVAPPRSPTFSTSAQAVPSGNASDLSAIIGRRIGENSSTPRMLPRIATSITRPMSMS